MATRTRTKLQREKDLERISAMRLEEKTLDQIAEEIGISRAQVSYDLKELKKRWREDALANTEELQAVALAKCRHLEKTFWESWDQSKEVRETTTSTTEKTVGTASEGGSASSPLRQKAAMKKEQRDGDPRFLQGVERCRAMECELLGLNAKKGIDLHHSGAIAMTTQERLDLVTEVRKKLEPFPEARASLESLFQPSTNGD
jgi:hypothetical protein